MHSLRTHLPYFFLHLSSPFPWRQTVQKALQTGTRLFINVQSCQISLRITINRGHTKEVSLPAHSYIAPPLVTIGRQDIQGLSLWPTKPFLQSSCCKLHQTPRSTFKTTVNFHSLPLLELHSLMAVWHDPYSERVGKTCLHAARTCTSTMRKTLLRNIRFNQHSLRTDHSDYSFNLKTGCFEHQNYTAWERVGSAT